MMREVRPAEWDALLAELGVEDAYLRRASVEASALLEPSEAVFLADDRAALPVLLRAIPDTELRDVSAPYPSGGPVGPAGAGFWSAYAEWARERSVVSTFIRFHPLLQNQTLAPPEAELVRLADAAVWRLEGDLFAGMHRSHRNKARKAQKAGIEVTTERNPASLDGFLELHEATMRRQGASEFYAFGPDYWAKLRELGDGLVRLDATLDGELVASEVCAAGGTWLHYHMGVTSDRGRELGAANLLVYETAAWAQTNGFTELSLGSGVGGQEDSLWEFKQRFGSGLGRESWIGKLVNDPEAYARLAGAAETGGFFPAYRALRSG